ncbi:MAG: NIPSNAP family protein [Chloroflexi bacterium]|nr:NIPSNAP family protein [Chloroflexota bacterium]
MIYEFRTYDLKPRNVPLFEERTAEKIKEGRQNYSQLFGFWTTEVGPVNEVVHVWPYEDLEHRRRIRAQTAEDGVWPPSNADIINTMRSEIFLPAPFMENRGGAKLGPVYEMRIYTYAPGDIPKVIEIWGEHIEEREKYSPLVGAWYSELGALNTWIHMWAYESYDQRADIRAETRAKGVWPPPGGIGPVTQANKLLLPMSFSPLQ